MSRTYRQKEGIIYPDGRLTGKVPHICRCGWCTGTDKLRLEEKILDKEKKLQLKEWYGDSFEFYNDDIRWELTTEEWRIRDGRFLQEQLNWENY